MPKTQTGYVFYDKKRKAWTARLTYTDASGKRRNLKRQVENKTAGNMLLKQLLRELEDHGTQIVEGGRLTFFYVAEQYQQEKLIEPVYQGESKVAGLRSHVSLKRRLGTLVQHFGRKRVKAITHADITSFKLIRLDAPSQRNNIKKLAVATVNRELQLLRAVLNYAKQQGWIVHNPFERGAPLISLASEIKRDRILTAEEETRLLAACMGRRAHLRPILICALDTAMRCGELLQLRWPDVDLTAGLIQVRATTTKTLTARVIGMTQRVRAELQRLWEATPDADGLVFGIENNFKRSFASVCRLAGVEGFRFHDCRHTAATRLIQGGLAPMEAMKITGHTQVQTFARYINANEQAAQRAAAVLDQWRVDADQQTVSEYLN